MDSIIQLFDKRLKENQKLTPKMKDILSASLELFAEKGYSNTSTRDIAQAAKVAEGTIFKHFGSKENLLYATLIPILRHTLADDWLDKLASSQQAVKERNFEDFLDFMLTDRLMASGDNLKVMKILYTEYLYQGNMRDKLAELIPIHLIQEINKLLSHYKQAGEISALPNKEILRFIAGSLMGFVLTEDIHERVGVHRKKEIQHLIHFIAKGLSPDQMLDKK